MDDIKDVLIALKAEHDHQGDGWQRAHELAQQHEGNPRYDRLHALVHRIEGDEANARYWYRRAGEAPFAGDVAEEIELLMARLT